MEPIPLNCHRDLSPGFEFALKQLGYEILEETYDEEGYAHYVVFKNEE